MKNEEKKVKITEEVGTKLTDEQLYAVTGGKEQVGGNDSGFVKTLQESFTAKLENEGNK